MTAEDGKIYEKTAILEWFAKKSNPTTSPGTGAVIGTRLLPAVQVRNTIESLVKSGAIEGEIAEAWKQKLADEKLVKKMRAKAEGRDGDAMFRLGVWHEKGTNGFAKDAAQARAWYERSAAARDPKGMACFGSCLLWGFGGPIGTSLGLITVTQAADRGSDLGAYRLGKAFIKGLYGLSKDPVRARLWLTKVVDGECEVRHLSDRAKADAVRLFRELPGRLGRRSGSGGQ